MKTDVKKATYEAVRALMSRSEILVTVMKNAGQVTGGKAIDPDKCAKIYSKLMNFTTIVTICLCYLLFFRVFAGVVRRKQPGLH